MERPINKTYTPHSGQRRAAFLGRLLGSILLGLLLVGVSPARAQVSPSFYDYARPGLDWYTVETEHFDVVFHLDSAGVGNSRTARVVARVAEEIYEPITSLYQHRLDTKVSIILKDYEDYSNGAAYFFDNKIEIWTPALDSPLRGDHNWLRNVITHEFTHLVQVQKAMKSGRRIPFYYFQLLGYEDVKRPDVLYGYPNVVVTYPVPVLNNPAWLAEGTAQYQRGFLHYDQWDTHRDMLLRTRILAGKELSLADMGGFYSHTSLLRESVYNHGFAFTKYLARTYGEDVLRRLSEALGQWSNWNVERALEEVTGMPGKEVHRQWMHTLREAYEKRTEVLRTHRVEGRLVEAEGFSNFYPRLSPDGTRLAYVSNQGEDFNQMSLYVQDLEGGEVVSFRLGGAGGHMPAYTCAFGHRLKKGVGGAFAWRPDGEAIIYARTKDTPEGYRLSDLYELDLTTRKTRRITTGRRAATPAYAPDGRSIAFVGQGDGSTNLYLLDLERGSVRPLTTYEDGTQVSDPVWHPSGEWIYFGKSLQQGRDLYRVSPQGGAPEPVLATSSDERTPAFDPAGRYLYYASDASGIFNLYRIPVSELPLRPGSAAAEKARRLTNVLGGAFMPTVGAGGTVAFARYDWDGYKIARLDEAEPLGDLAGRITYKLPSILQAPASDAVAARWQQLNAFDDTDLDPLGEEEIVALRSEGLEEAGTQDDLEVKDYSNLFTSFSFFPVVRIDQYVERQRLLDARLPARSRGEVLLRNLKTGVYMASREMLEEMSFMGGLLIGPGSREVESAGDFFSPSHLLKLERDAFLMFDYKKGFSFLPKRWSPQLSVEMYNIRRNVDHGLSIEEFPCTACLPDTTLADLSYSLWEAGLYARSKITRNLLVELGYRYSPYRVTTERFFSKESDQYIPESSSRYFIGRGFSAKAYYEAMHPHRNSDVVPEGLRVNGGYEYEQGRLLERFSIEQGALVPHYARYGNHRLSLDARFGMRLPGRIASGVHGVGLRLRGSTIVGPALDDFFNDYVGGLIGARGYPFYALGGNETLWMQAAYHFPILPRIHRQFLFTYVDKLYGRVYADAAMAWSGPWPGMDAVRRDVGAELRLGLGSFYLLPTAVFVSATYGLDAFDFKLDEGFLTPAGQDHVRYGREVLWHFGVLFGFDL